MAEKKQKHQPVHRQAIDPTSTLAFTRIAQKLAQRYEPDFPDISGCTTSLTHRRGLWDHQDKGEDIQDGRGWRYLSISIDGERYFSAGLYTTTTATAIHPEWTLTVQKSTHSDGREKVQEFWYTFETFEHVPDFEAKVHGMAEVLMVVAGRGVKGLLVVGRVSATCRVRLFRASHLRWQGRLEKLAPVSGEQLPIAEGRRFMASLDVPFDIEEGDTLEFFSK